MDKEAVVVTVDAVATNVETMTKDTLQEEEVVDGIASPETTLATIILILSLNSRSLTLTVVVASAVVVAVDTKVVVATSSRIETPISSRINKSQ